MGRNHMLQTHLSLLLFHDGLHIHTSQHDGDDDNDEGPYSECLLFSHSELIATVLVVVTILVLEQDF